MQPNESGLNNKVAVITGASSGIGKACAQRFAANGFDLVLAARNMENLHQAAADLQSLEISVILKQTDVSNEAACRDLINLAIEEFGRMDVLINNAGVSMRALFADVDLMVLKKLMDINFWGTVYCTKYALPHLIHNSGSLIGISSVAGKKGLPGRTGYSASKFAMEGFLETLRIENLKKNLHVLVACPGFTSTAIRKTAFTSDGSQQGESPRDEAGMMSPEEVADKIYRAYRLKKRDLIMTAEGKLTIMLNKFFPQMMDRIVYNHMAKEPDSPFK